MFDLPSNTLSMALVHPLFDKIDMSDIPVSRLTHEFELLEQLKKTLLPNRKP